LQQWTNTSIISILELFANLANQIRIKNEPNRELKSNVNSNLNIEYSGSW
jgi:hypothetical protein